jgi:hypothetical protein
MWKNLGQRDKPPCVLFVVICFGAIGLNLFTEWMSSIGMPAYITYAGSLLGYLVFTADVVCFVVFVIKEALVLIRQIVQGWPEEQAMIGAALTQDDRATGAAQVLYRTETLDDRKPAQTWYEKATIRFYIRSLPLAVCFIGMAGLAEVLMSSIHRTTFAISPLQFKILVISGVVLAIGCGLGLLVTIVEGVSHLSRRRGNINKHSAQTTVRSRPKTPRH